MSEQKSLRQGWKIPGGPVWRGGTLTGVEWSQPVHTSPLQHESGPCWWASSHISTKKTSFSQEHLHHPHEPGPQSDVYVKEVLWQQSSVLSPQFEALFPEYFATKGQLGSSLKSWVQGYEMRLAKKWGGHRLAQGEKKEFECPLLHVTDLLALRPVRSIQQYNPASLGKWGYRQTPIIIGSLCGANTKIANKWHFHGNKIKIKANNKRSI